MVVQKFRDFLSTCNWYTIFVISCKDERWEIEICGFHAVVLELCMYSDLDKWGQLKML